MPPNADKLPEKPPSDLLYRVGNWWRKSVMPSVGGALGGLALAAVALSIAEAMGMAPHTDPYNSVAFFTWLVGGLGIYWLMRWRACADEHRHGRARAQVAQAEGRLTPEQVMQAQVQRIQLKCKRVVQQARKAGGVYSDLAQYAPELAMQAKALAARFAQLRLAAAATGHEAVVGPGLPAGTAGAEAAQKMLQDEVEAATAAQARLDKAVAENQAQQHVCLARLERIEDVLDAAWLDVSQAPSVPVAAATSPTIVQDMEREMQAAKAAVEEVEERQEGEHGIVQE